jgi:dolichyl-diphosphooligosaccharide--protein glycosyltransferase
LVLILVPTNVTGFTADCSGDTNAWTASDCFGGPGESLTWEAELAWMNANTPEPPVGLNATFEQPGAERYEYPEGMYGVLSWWDYGHQILFDGERAAVANPFQQQAPLASEVFTADSEEEARQLLADYLGEDNEIRYLMIDDAMASTKFGAITVWADERDTYTEGQSRSYAIESQGDASGRTLDLQAPSDEVRGWFLQDVFHDDASGMEHFRLVKEHPQFSLIGSSASVSEDRVQVRGYNTILDRGPWDKYRDLEREGAYGAGGNNVIYDAEGLSRLKTYEHVPGATITGQADPGTEVTATLDLRATASDRPFTYEQTTQADEDGTFALTVPYSTSDDVGPQEGGTNLSVQPQGPYDVTVGNETAQLQVPEPAVLNGQAVPVGN